MPRRATLALAVAALIAAAPATALAADQPDVSLPAQATFTATGAPQTDGRFGSRVVVLDFNGDGIDDIAVGASGETWNGRAVSGAVYVLFGPRRGALDVATMTPGQGIRIDGAVFDSRLGTALDRLPDQNGDGIDDLLVGAPTNARAYVIFGDATPDDIDLAAPPAGAVVEIAGPDDVLFAFDLAAVGDVDGDGEDDVAIGAQRADPAGRQDAGSVYVVSGPFDPSVPVVDVTGAPAGYGARIDGAAGDAPPNGDGAGESVVAAGDFNGDGEDDLAFAAGATDHNGRDQSGSAFVLYGGSLTGAIDLDTLTTAQGVRIDGPVAHGRLREVAGVGDVDGDGRDDVLVGTALAPPGGEAALVYGRPSPAANLDLGTPDTARFFTLTGAAGDVAGGEVGGGADIDGDGVPDLFVGAGAAGGAVEGAVHVVYGGTTPAGGALAALAPSQGFRLVGAANDRLPSSMAVSTNFLGPGATAIVVGANRATVGPGRVYAFTTDRDADGRLDVEDNCRDDANAGQEDLDGDGRGDACDDDADGDGVADAVEAVIGTDPRSTDTDGDGVGDAADRCPTVPGTDANGCPVGTVVTVTVPGPPRVVGGGPSARDAARRVTPRVRARSHARRGRRAVRVRTTGRLGLPAGFGARGECETDGRVTVRVKVGRRTVSTRRASVRADCTFRSTVTFRRLARLRDARVLRVLVRFAGDERFRPARASTGRVRVPRSRSSRSR